MEIPLLPIANEPLPPGPAPACPICGMEGEIWAREARDLLWNVPGSWSYRQCGVCRSVWMDPRPAPDQIGAFYPPVYYTHSVKQDSTQRRSEKVKELIVSQKFGYAPPPTPSSTSNRILAALLGEWPWYRELAGYDVRFLNRVASGRLFDVGCGSGEFLDRMKMLGWSVAGLDPDPLAAEVARNRGLDVICSSIEKAPAPSEPLDAVTLCHVIEHVTDPAWVLTKLFGWVKSGGHLVAMYPNAAGTLAGWYGRDWVDLDAPRHLTFASPPAAEAVLLRLGAQVQVRTLTRTCAAVIQQCRNARRAGASELYSPPGVAARLLERVARGLDVVCGNRGNEVILVARKP